MDRVFQSWVSGFENGLVLKTIFWVQLAFNPFLTLISGHTIQNLEKRITCSLSVLWLFPTTYFDQISHKSLAKISQEARESEGLVKINYSIARSLFKRAGNSN